MKKSKLLILVPMLLITSCGLSDWEQKAIKGASETIAQKLKASDYSYTYQKTNPTTKVFIIDFYTWKDTFSISKWKCSLDSNYKVVDLGLIQITY